MRQTQSGQARPTSAACLWFRCGPQVVALARYGMPHTAARIRHITAVTRDDVDMKVPDGLPGGQPRR